MVPGVEQDANRRHAALIPIRSKGRLLWRPALVW